MAFSTLIYGSLLALGVGRDAPIASSPSWSSLAGDRQAAPARSATIAADRPQARCDEPIDVYEDGAVVDTICPSEATGRGLTVLDLGDDWLPSPFRGPGGDPTGYGKTYLALAAGKPQAVPHEYRAAQDRFFELFGIFPTLGLLRERMLDERRHDCHDRVDKQYLERLKTSLNPWEDRAVQRSRRWTANNLEPRLLFGVNERKLRSIHELKDDPRYGPTYTQYMHVANHVRVVESAQAHLRCEGLLAERAERGVIDDVTHAALSAYQRRHMLVAWTLGVETAKTFVTDSRHLDLLGLLRMLRERIADQTGIIEDGTAGAGRHRIAGHTVDTRVFRTVASPRLQRAGQDHLGRAADHAARGLGWTDPSKAIAFFDKLKAKDTKRFRVALRLPARPSYHSKHMDLFAVIDRGEVNFDYPFTAQGNRRFARTSQGPTLTLYARTSSGNVPLMRWPTTIGGYKPERRPDGMRMVYKESPAGPRLWRDLVIAPRWIPPRSTSARELLRPTKDGMQLKRDLLGPSYASAFGLAMLIHHRADQQHGEKSWTDQGIRTHGSVSYGSIEQGESHGCHRLHNHRSLRLASFLLKHRNHARRGPMPFDLKRSYVWGGRRFGVRFDNRGYHFELTPPVPVKVTRGRIVGEYKRPRGSVPLPANLRRRLGG